MAIVLQRLTIALSGDMGREWSVPPAYVSNEMGHCFVELNKNDISLRRWLVNRMKYDPRITSVINEIASLRAKASLAEITPEATFNNVGKKSVYRIGIEQKRMVDAAASLDPHCVNVELPEFTVGDAVVQSCTVAMPFDIDSKQPVLVEANINGDSSHNVFYWVFMRCQQDVEREGRQRAEFPPISGGYYHKVKKSYVIKSPHGKWKSFKCSSPSEVEAIRLDCEVWATAGA